MKLTTLLGIAALTMVHSIIPATAGDLDGRTGPTTMKGAQLDIALMRLNTHLQARYVQDEMLAHLDVVPAQDFATVAAATVQSPLDARVSEKGEFGFAVSDGASLVLHLASFNEERVTRGDDLFIRIVRFEAGKTPGFESIARDNFAGFSGGPIMDDRTLNAGMAALAKGMREFEARTARLEQSIQAITDRSFDDYTNALLLF